MKQGKSFAKRMLWSMRRQHPTSVLSPGKSHGWRSLVGCSPWGNEESDMTERLHFHALEKEMATHSSVLAWRIPVTAEPGGLPSMGSQSQTRPKRLSSSSSSTGRSKHPLPTTQEKTLHMDIARWSPKSSPKSDWLYSLQPKVEKLYPVSKIKTGSWLQLRSWTSYCQIQT